MQYMQNDLARAHIEGRLAESRQRARATKIRRSGTTSRRGAGDMAAQHPARIW